MDSHETWPIHSEVGYEDEKGYFSYRERYFAEEEKEAFYPTLEAAQKIEEELTVNFHNNRGWEEKEDEILFV